MQNKFFSRTVIYSVTTSKPVITHWRRKIERVSLAPKKKVATNMKTRCSPEWFIFHVSPALQLQPETSGATHWKEKCILISPIGLRDESICFCCHQTKSPAVVPAIYLAFLLTFFPIFSGLFKLMHQRKENKIHSGLFMWKLKQTTFAAQ